LNFFCVVAEESDEQLDEAEDNELRRLAWAMRDVPSLLV